MFQTSRFASVLIAACSLCAISTPSSAFSRAGMPVRCEINVSEAETDANVTVDCETADGVAFTNVPAGKYFFVTDILVQRRVSSQTALAVSVRAWAPTGFINSVYINVNYNTHPYGVMEHFQTPMLIVPPGGHLGTYAGSGSSHIVQVSGILTDSLVGDPDMFKDGFESVARGFVATLERIYG